MNIKEFKVGDIVTRNEPVKYSHNGNEDSSYTGERITLRGHDDTSKIIFFTVDNKIFVGDIMDLSYARDAWNEGWCYYPETLWQSIKKFLTK